MSGAHVHYNDGSNEPDLLTQKYWAYWSITVMTRIVPVNEEFLNIY